MKTDAAALLANHARPDPTPLGCSGSPHRLLFERAAEHSARFRDGIGARPPQPAIAAAELQARFDGATPEIGMDPVQAIDALNAAADPGLSGSAGPRFFGWVIGASAPAGVAADLRSRNARFFLEQRGQEFVRFRLRKTCDVQRIKVRKG